MKSTIVQRGMQSLSDAGYTAMADGGCKDWLKPIGYGLCQWTLVGRKHRLREFAKAQGVSVGDETMQCLFALKELREDFSKLWEYLISDRCEVGEACDWICREFENPAIKNYSARRAFAAEFDYLGNMSEKPTCSVSEKTYPKDPSIVILQMVMQYNGYWDEDISGYKSKNFFEKLREFTNDMEEC